MQAVSCIFMCALLECAWKGIIFNKLKKFAIYAALLCRMLRVFDTQLPH